MIQEDHVERLIHTAFHRFPSAQTGLHFYSVAAQNTFGDHQVHLLVVHNQNPYPFTGKRPAARRLGFLKSILSHLAVQQVGNGKRRERLMDCKKPALPAKHILLLRNHNYPQRISQFLIIRLILFVFRLRDKYMCQIICPQQLAKPVEIMHLIPFNPKTIHQIRNQSIIILPDLVTDVFLRPEIAGNA